MQNLKTDNNNSQSHRDEWKEYRLEDCVDILDSQRVPINSDDRAKRQGKVPYYGATGQVGWIDGYLFDEELVLLGEDGAPFLDKSKPISYIVNGKSWVNNHAHVLRAKKGIANNWFIKYYLDYFDFSDYVGGTTRLKLNQSVMKSIPISLPNIEDQIKIAKNIKDITSNVGTSTLKIANAKKLVANFKQTIITNAVTGKLTDSSTEHWTDKKLKDVCLLITDGDHQAPPKAPSGIPFIVISDVNKGVLNLNTRRFVPEEYFNNLKAIKKPLKGDVLYTTVGSFGIPIRVPLDARFVFQRHIALLRPNSEIMSDYLFYLLKSKLVFNQAAEVATGTAQLTVPLSGLRNIEINLPSIDEQKIIIKKINEYMDLANSIEKLIEKAEQNALKLNQSILKKMFSLENN